MLKSELPPASSEAEFDALDLDSAPFLDAATDVARSAGFADLEIQRIDAGSLPVFAVGDGTVLKFFPPYWRSEGEREARFLSFLHGRLPVAVPELLGRFERDGWEALVLRRLRGRAWSDVTDELTAGDHEALAGQAGELAAALHALDIGALEPEPVAWPDFVAERRAGAVARQRGLGLEPQWLEQIEPWLAEVELRAEPEVFLHTEIMREHLFVERQADAWRIAGLLDFEPSRTGAAEYELASIGVFVARGEGRLMRRFLLSYGYSPSAIDVELQRRCMAWGLLHRYSNVAGYMRRLPVEGSVRTFEDLARRWWPIAD